MLKILKTLNLKKATGCDQIPAKLLRHVSFQNAPVISNILNKALDEGTFPNILKKAEVIPVYKKSDILNKSNYRPVSILLILAKVFEKSSCPPDHSLFKHRLLLSPVSLQTVWLSGHAAPHY